MRLRALFLTVAVLAAVATSGGDARAQDLARLFPNEADVYVDAAGMARLPLPPEIVAECTPDLADLRLFDASGREVPYLVDPGVPGGRERRARLTADARVLDLQREEVPRDDVPALTREVYRVALPERAPVGESWSLIVGSRQPRFVRRVEVRGVGADGVAVPLVPRASLVRLGQPLVDRDRISLPPFEGDAIELRIEGEEGFYLEPELRFESERRLAPGDASETPLAIVEQTSADDRTVLELARPPAMVEARLVFTTTTPAFDRRVTVYDVAADGTRREIGDGRIVRAPLGGEVDEQLAVAIERAHGERLRVEIEDGDSPPLADTTVRLAYDAPTLLFALPSAAGAGAPSGVLRFGGARAHAPRYDVARLFAGDGATGAAVLQAARELPLARLGPIRPNDQFDARPALAPLMEAGAEVDVEEWRWRRPVTVPASPEGLVRLRLTPDDLARAQDDYDDLRVVDDDARQWPYLIAPAHERASLALAVDGPRSKDGRSRWRLELPGEETPVDRIVLYTARPVLGRSFRLRAIEDDQERLVAEGTLAQDLRRPQPLSIATGDARTARFELEVDDGDDAPIALERAEAVVALPSLLIAAPPGDYTLLAGNPDAEAPRYEITRVRDVVLDLRTVAADAGPGADDPDWSGVPGGWARRRAVLEQVAVWGTIVLAAALLGWLTLRMVRRPD